MEGTNFDTEIAATVPLGGRKERNVGVTTNLADFLYSRNVLLLTLDLIGLFEKIPPVTVPRGTVVYCLCG